MKKLLVILLSVTLGFICACTDESESDEGDDDDVQGPNGNGDLDWHTSDCSELGGVETPLGACVVECTLSPCPTSQTECEAAPGLIYICTVSSCSTDTDCGPEGWYCSGGGCTMTCNTVSGGAQSSDCATGWKCYAPDYGDDQRPYCAYGVSSGDSCGGCGTDNAGGCCGGIFCAGACIGSPCC